jgi:hypothetical protein
MAVDELWIAWKKWTNFVRDPKLVEAVTAGAAVFK